MPGNRPVRRKTAFILLIPLSRFMGNLNEHIARKANKEDNCRGRFWEGRFSMQALLDVAALLRTSCYVDLNPVRAMKAKTPEGSKYTSVYRRLRESCSGLTQFQNKAKQSKVSGQFDKHIPITFTEYLELLDWTGRQQRKGKRGVIDAATLSINSRLGYSEEQWHSLVNPSVNWKQKALGGVERLRVYCELMEQKWIWGMSGAVG